MIDRPLELSGGTLNVTGTVQVNNTFTIDGGTLGQATVAAGTILSGTRWGGGLDGVTLNGNLDLTVGGAVNVTVTNGLILNGTASLGSNAGDWGYLRFTGSQTLGGTGSVVFGNGFNGPFNTLWMATAGDTLLRSMAALFVSNIRGQDLVVRYGGEEFCLVMPDTDILGAHHLLDKLRKPEPR